jgi:uncharacterized protein YuzE
MPDAPAIQILVTPDFQGQLRKLAKRHRSIRSDLQPLFDDLESGNCPGDQTLAGGLGMKKISYSKDIDALLIELSKEPIAHAEAEDQVILHYSENEKLVLVEVLDFRRFMSEETITALLAS